MLFERKEENKNVVNCFDSVNIAEISTECTLLDRLKSAITTVNNMRIIPPVCAFSIKTNRTCSLSATDISKDHRLLAGCFTESCDIFFMIDPEPEFRETETDLPVVYNSVKVARGEYAKDFKVSDDSVVPQENYLHGHKMPVTGLKCVSERDLLLSCSLDKTVRAWSTDSFKTVETYSNIPSFEFYWDIDVSRKSSHFVTCGTNGVISLYSFDRKFPLQNFPGHTKDVNCVKFHPNGIYFATASVDFTIKLWNSQSGSVARTFQDDADPKSLAFSPDGKYLASYSAGRIKIWDLASGRLQKMFIDTHEESISYNLCFSEFGNILASGGVQKKLKLWDVSNTVLKQEGLVGSSSLLKCHTFPRKIQLLKFDEHNYFSCVTT